MDSINLDYLGSGLFDRSKGERMRDLTSISSDRLYDFESSRRAWEKAAQEKAERERKAAEATIELNEQTKVQNRILSEQNQRLNETIMQLKSQIAGGPQSVQPFEYDVFVSHANDNKAEFVNGLIKALEKLGIFVLSQIDSVPLKLAFEHLLALNDVFFAAFMLEPLANLRFCRGGLADIDP